MAEAQEEKLYVAVPEKSKDGMSVLRWALRNAPKDVRIVIIHVYIFDKTIPTPFGGRVHPNLASPMELTAYRREEKAKAERKLDNYAKQCSKAQFKCDKLALGSDNITEGILKLISIMEIKKMVMGAAADRYYSMSMTEPISNTAKSVVKNADPSCKIWFVCKGDLICTREANHEKLIKTPPLPCSLSLSKAIAKEQYTYRHSKLSPEMNVRVSDASSSFMTEVDIAICDDEEFNDTLADLNLAVQKVKSTLSMEKQRMQNEIDYLTAQLNEKDKLLREANMHNMRLESHVKELEENIASITNGINLVQSENIQLRLVGEENLRRLQLTTIQEMILEESCKGLGDSLVAINGQLRYQLLENRQLQKKHHEVGVEFEKLHKMLIISDG